MLQIHTKAPQFHLLDIENKVRSLDEFLGKKIVLYFYPKDSTGGCTKQALSYKEAYTKFSKKDIVVIGISKDSVFSHQKFIKKYELPFLLLSDESLDAILAYDVWHEKKLYGKPYMGTVRTTYIIDEKGFIIYANDKVKASTDAFDILKEIEKE